MRCENPASTIAAIATPNGYGGVGIVRLSGPGVPEIAKRLCSQKLPPRYAVYTPFLNDNHTPIDTGIALYFPAPHSFTGEDVLELQGHGGPVILNLLLKRTLALGAILARPGEFSERAFLNNKIDLAQAEAIADLISASNEQAALAAQRSLQGEFSKAVHALNEKIIHLRMYVEAAIDFPEEEIDFLTEGNVGAQLNTIIDGCEALQQTAKQGVLLQQGICVVLAGAPNAGKSSVLNALAEKETAIVTAIPGTTRDVLREQINIEGIPLHISDTAGLRVSSDVIEQEGVRRAQMEIAKADVILWVIDSSHEHPVNLEALNAALTENKDKVIIVYNKIDLSGVHAPDSPKTVYISAKTGAGLTQLKEKILTHMNVPERSADQMSARIRHLDYLQRARGQLNQGYCVLAEQHAGELLAQHLRAAHDLLGEITGVFTTEDLLGEIFSSFCIGK